jgi:hypothetical protein
MTEPMDPSSHAHMPPPAALNVPLLAKQMQEQTLTLAGQLQKILEDPSLSAQETFLREVTTNGSQLNKTVEQSLLIR